MPEYIARRSVGSTHIATRRRQVSAATVRTRWRPSTGRYSSAAHVGGRIPNARVPLLRRPPGAAGLVDVATRARSATSSGLPRTAGRDLHSTSSCWPDDELRRVVVGRRPAASSPQRPVVGLSPRWRGRVVSATQREREPLPCRRHQRAQLRRSANIASQLTDDHCDTGSLLSWVTVSSTGLSGRIAAVRDVRRRDVYVAAVSMASASTPSRSCATSCARWSRRSWSYVDRRPLDRGDGATASSRRGAARRCSVIVARSRRGEQRGRWA